ncbi:MAG: oligosaccharide flippase family protein [Candidatus Gracilibacteria bacterium]|nr:oligosaccharide flippase family protein [Candidatus Gracilibacteria bacterium]MDD5179226.1 oligosaccharide flippase family protein [Candidatus Gracilibacteria bacterium]
MSNARKVLGNTAVQILGRLITAALSIVILKIISTYLGKAGYGEYTTVYEFLSFFAIIADFGIFQIAVKEISKHPERRKEIFGNIFALRSILAITAMILSIGFAFLIPQYAGTPIPVGVAVAAATTFFTIIFGTISSLLQVDLRMQWNVLGLVIAKITAVIWMVAAIFYVLPDNPEAGFYQLLWAGVVGGVLQVATVLFAVRKTNSLCFRFDFALWKKILIETLPYGAAVLLATIYVREDIILLSLLKNSEEVGLYGVAARIMENLAVISIFFLNSILPILSRLFHDNQEKLKRLIQLSFDFLMMIGLPIAVGGITLAYPIIAFVSSPAFLSNSAIGFYGSDTALQLLLVAMLLAYLGNLFGFTLLAGGKQVKLMYINAIAVVFNLVGNLMIIPLLGFRGAAITSIISQIFVCILGFIFLRQLLGDFRFRLGSVSKAILAAIAMGVSIHFLQPILFQVFGGNKSLLLIIPISGIVYGGILLLTKAITPEMWELLRKKA